LPKEFNLDDYQYSEEHITFDEFLRYQPLKNDLDPAASFDGALFRHEGDQWVHIAKLSAANIWTLFTDRDGSLRIRNGYQVDGRLGYFHCAQMHNAHRTIIVDGLDLNNF
jgi:hypothetical protein